MIRTVTKKQQQCSVFSRTRDLLKGGRTSTPGLLYNYPVLGGKCVQSPSHLQEKEKNEKLVQTSVSNDAKFVMYDFRFQNCK